MMRATTISIVASLLFTCQASAGDSLGAVDSFLKAQALAPDDARIRMGLAEALYKNGEYRSALGQFRLAGEGDEEYSPRALYNAGNAAFEMGDLETSLAHYTEALAAGFTDPDLLHNLELAQRLLEQAQQQQEQGEDGEPQEGEQQQQQQEGEQQQQQQEGEQSEEQEEQEGEEQDQEGEDEAEDEGEEEQQQEAPALPDSMPPMPALADTLAVPDGMTAEQAMRLLDALDHDEEELRRSIQRRLRRGDAKSENDW